MNKEQLQQYLELHKDAKERVVRILKEGKKIEPQLFFEINENENPDNIWLIHSGNEIKVYKLFEYDFDTIPELVCQFPINWLTMTIKDLKREIKKKYERKE